MFLLVITVRAYLLLTIHYCLVDLPLEVFP